MARRLAPSATKMVRWRPQAGGVYATLKEVPVSLWRAAGSWKKPWSMISTSTASTHAARSSSRWCRDRGEKEGREGTVRHDAEAGGDAALDAALGEPGPEAADLPRRLLPLHPFSRPLPSLPLPFLPSPLLSTSFRCRKGLFALSTLAACDNDAIDTQHGWDKPPPPLSPLPFPPPSPLLTFLLISRPGK